MAILVGWLSGTNSKYEHSNKYSLKNIALKRALKI